MLKDLKGKLGECLLEDAKIECKDDVSSGSIEGYLAAFNNIDQADERILPGAFSKTIRDSVNKGMVPLMGLHFAHGGDIRESVGIIKSAKEDDYGLKIYGEYFDDPDSQEMRMKVKSARSKGARVGMSVGYRTIRFKTNSIDGKTVYDLVELQLREGTLTFRPCNEKAYVTSAKSDDELIEGKTREEIIQQLAANLNVAEATIEQALNAGSTSKAEIASTSRDASVADFTAQMQAVINRNRITLFEHEE